ncbi:MAG: MaoC family dehydratase N-terminal domain-containing protein [Propionibacteriaceae bacterium]|jgi:acyl dehydratase|nr:MaoC family dehydratase N-terminal domain-containing protein [Propionibacteriaceae bacterium]
MSDLNVGLKLPGKTIAVTRELLRRYAAASGDSNPIHLSDAAARAIGLDGVLAHGMWTMGAAVQVVLEWLDGDAARIKSYKVRFAAPLYVPETGTTVEVAATVSALTATTATITLQVCCGDLQLLGGAKVEVSV